MEKNKEDVTMFGLSLIVQCFNGRWKRKWKQTCRTNMLEHGGKLKETNWIIPKIQR